MHFEFGESLRISGHSATYLRALLELGEEGIGLVSEVGHVAVTLILHLQVDAVGGTVSRNLRHLERQHLRVLDTLAVQIETIDNKIYIVLETRTVVPVLETDDE